MWDLTLREENQSLISKLKERQAAVHQANKSARGLHTALDNFQSRLDSLDTRARALHSNSLTRQNINNSNAAAESSISPVSDQHAGDGIEQVVESALKDVESGCSISSLVATGNTNNSNACADQHSPIADVYSAEAPVEVTSGRILNDLDCAAVKVDKMESATRKQVRRRLAAEISPEKSQLASSSPLKAGHTKEKRGVWYEDENNLSYSSPDRLSGLNELEDIAKSRNHRTYGKELLLTPSNRRQSPSNNGQSPSNKRQYYYPETPKSILKHRKLIDSKVHVASKYQHTPGWMDRAKHAPTTNRSRNASYVSQVGNHDESTKAQPISRIVPSRKDRAEVQNSLSMFSLNGDDSVVLDLERQFRRAELQEDNPVHKPPENKTSSQPRNTTFIKSSVQHTLYKPQASPLHRKLFTREDVEKSDNQRILGYDWIAALLENKDPHITEKSEDYFRDLKEFRRLHRDECQNEAISALNGNASKSYVDTLDISVPAPEPTSPNHTCIHSYAVNERLFTVPANADRHGNSRCAVCSKKKTAPTSSSPGFVRVSIPRSTLASPYRVKPHRRKSFDPSNSAALSRHCLAGWVHQRPGKVPLGKNVDLLNETNRLKSKWTTTMKEAEELAGKVKTGPRKSRSLDQTTLYNREAKHITNQLLEVSNAIQFQNQLARKTTLH